MIKYTVCKGTVVGIDKTVDKEPMPSVAYVTFGYQEFHEFVRRSIDTRLHFTDKLHVGGSVFADGSTLGSN